MKNLRPLFFFSSLLLIVGLACSALGGGSTPAPAQPQPPVEQPTQPPAPVSPTDVPQPTAAAPVVTEPPVSAAQQFFTEEFDAPLSADWDVLTVTGSDKANTDKVTVEAKNGNLSWDFESEYVYYYLFYNAFTYEDVRIDLRADNRGKNNNSISLICRYDPKVGWYEFNIANNGLYDISYAEVTSSGEISYKLITNGGSNAIKQGKEVNEYGISCKGQQLTLYINGKEAKSLTEKKYALREGNVGMSVSAFDVLPIQIEMDWFKISEP
jgi:hypothetical protein